MKVKVTEHREVVIELNPESYPEECRTPEGMVEVERLNSGEIDYMDMIGASSDTTFKIIDEDVDQ